MILGTIYCYAGLIIIIAVVVAIFKIMNKK